MVSFRCLLISIMVPSPVLELVSIHCEFTRNWKHFSSFPNVFDVPQWKLVFFPQLIHDCISHQVFLAAHYIKLRDAKESVWRRRLTLHQLRGRRMIWKKLWMRFARARLRCRKRLRSSAYPLVRFMVAASERKSNFHAVIQRRGLKTP